MVWAADVGFEKNGGKEMDAFHLGQCQLEALYVARWPKTISFGRGILVAARPLTISLPNLLKKTNMTIDYAEFFL